MWWSSGWVFSVLFFQAIESHGKNLYPEHLSLSEVQRGIKSGKYLQGSFMASRENYLEGNVSIRDEENMVIIVYLTLLRTL